MCKNFEISRLKKYFDKTLRRFLKTTSEGHHTLSARELKETTVQMTSDLGYIYIYKPDIQKSIYYATSKTSTC